MAVNPIIKCFWRDLVPEYCQGLYSSVVYPAPLYCVKSHHGRSNWSLPRLLLHMHAEEIIPTFLTSNIYIGLCLSIALTMTWLRSYEMFEVLLIIGINKSVCVWGIIKFHLLRDVFPYRLARGIPLKEGVPYPLQSKLSTPTPHLRWTILALQISLNTWLPPNELYCDSQ